VTTASHPNPPSTPRYFRMAKKPRRWLGILFYVVWSSIGIIVAVATAFLLFIDDSIQAAQPNTEEFRLALSATEPVLPGRPINILLMGSDKRGDEGDRGRSDSLILVRMDGDRDFISMLSFPRDLYVEIPGYGRGKINEAYTYGEKATIDTVEKLTGESVNHFVNIDFQGFVRLVDAVGGVYLDVDRRYFNDNTGAGENYDMIDLKAGYQRLDGANALDFARYRHTDSDFSRIQRQQQFLSELKRQTKRIGNLISLPAFGKIFRDNITMSIKSRGELVKIINLALSVDKARIGRYRINGGLDMLSDGQSIVVANPDEIATKVEQWRNPEFLDSAPKKKIDPADVTVAVLNGNGRVLAGEAGAALLVEKGFKARNGGNADRFDYTASEVHFAPGKRDEARAVQKLFGPFTGIEPAGDLEVKNADVTLVLGTNFDGALVPPPPPPPPVKAETNWTTALLPTVRNAEKAVDDLTTIAPLRVPPGSRLRQVRLYRINTGGSGPWALKMVFELGGSYKYWAFTQTSWDDEIPILEGETAVIKRGKREYRTFYDGKNLVRVGWKENGMAYWVSNTMENELNSETMHAIARSAKPWKGAKLPAGVADTPMEIEEDAPTP
jgi:LCP family protein required for cell wall assembly